jgi:hypothetical protein
MKILFTFLSISTENDFYLNASKNLVNEILSNSSHDILLTTNNVEYFDEINNPRFSVRNNVPENSMFTYKNGGEFNYNLKYLAFKDLPNDYDVIFYVDGDIKSNFWNDFSEFRLKELMGSYDFVATRLNCILKNEVKQHIETGSALFSHKILSYNVLSWGLNDPIMDSCLPSEHFLIFKYNKEKLETFANKWSELNGIMQSQNGGNGSWGDGFEMGISAKYAGYDNLYDLNYGDLQNHFGFFFNGNKK